MTIYDVQPFLAAVHTTQFPGDGVPSEAELECEAPKEGIDEDEWLVVESFRGELSQHFDTWEELRDAVGGTPIINKFACILKTKLDGSIKRRIIMDSKRSGVTAASRKMYKATLPRATDLVADNLALQAAASPGEEVESMVLDAEDAF